VAALKKTLDLLEAIPERPFPHVKRGRKKEEEKVKVKE